MPGARDCPALHRDAWVSSGAEGNNHKIKMRKENRNQNALKPTWGISHFGSGATGNTNSLRQLGKITAAAFSPLPKQCHQPPENESSYPASKSATSSCFQSITFGKKLKIPREVYGAGARCCQPAARPGESPAPGLGLLRSLEALKGLSFPVGMSQC